MIDPNTGDLWGYIVAGCPEARFGYMILAKDIFNDITKHVGGGLELASSHLAAPPAYHEGSSTTPSTTETAQRLISMDVNQSKEELLRYLGMSEAVYSQMAVSSRNIEIMSPINN